MQLCESYKEVCKLFFRGYHSLDIVDWKWVPVSVTLPRILTTIVAQQKRSYPTWFIISKLPSLIQIVITLDIDPSLNGMTSSKWQVIVDQNTNLYRNGDLLTVTANTFYIIRDVDSYKHQLRASAWQNNSTPPPP